jgi:hypothetical protein
MTGRPNDHDVALYAAYLTLAERYRPDAAGEPGDAGAAHFRKIEEAYNILRDALRRMAFDTPRTDQHFTISEDAAPYPNKTEEQAAPQTQNPWQAPRFESTSELPPQTAVGKGERKGNVERLIIIFLAAATLLFCSWIVDVLNRVPASPWQPSDQNVRSNPAPQPGDMNQSNSAPRSSGQNHQPNLTPQPNDQSHWSNPIPQQSDQKHEPVPPSRARPPRLIARDPSRPAPPHYGDDRNYWDFRVGRAHDPPPRLQFECWRDRSIRGRCFD